MCTVDLVTREGGQVVAVLRGGLDLVSAAAAAARLAVIAPRDGEVIVDLAGLAGRARMPSSATVPAV